MRVLVASEDAEVRARATGAMHARPDVEVIEAASASEAHRRLDEDDIDVIVMDGDMRPEGGYSVVYELRAAAELAGEHAPPAIMLVDREQDRWLADWAGATDALLKPVNPFDLAERVGELHRLTGGATPTATAGEPGGGQVVDESGDAGGETSP